MNLKNLINSFLDTVLTSRSRIDETVSEEPVVSKVEETTEWKDLPMNKRWDTSTF